MLYEYSDQVAVKKTFFSENSISSDLFEYLEDSRSFKVPVIDFITKVAEKVLAESFNTIHPKDYKNIVRLFACRNKIIHRGRLIFIGDKDVPQIVNIEIAKAWYMSVRVLLRWLGKQREKINYSES